MEKKLSDKQIKILRSNGVSAEEILSMSYQDASDKIGQILSMPKENTAEKPKVAQNAPKREFHLTPEQVRTNALMAAIEVKKSFKPEESKEDLPLLDLAQQLEQYISGYWN